MKRPRGKRATVPPADASPPAPKIRERFRWLPPLAFFLAGTAFVCWFESLEKTAIYVFDYCVYWSNVLYLANAAQQGAGVLAILGAAYQSTYTSVYNLLGALPLVPFQSLPIGSHLAYTLSILWFYGSIVYLGVSLVASGFRRDGAPAGGFAPAIALFTTSLMWVPLLHGYVDCGGLGIALVILWLFIRCDYRPKAAGLLVAAGVLLGYLPLFRRWYAFWAEAFLLIAGIDAAIRCVQNLRAKKPLPLIPALVFLGLPAGFATLLALFPDFIELSLHTQAAISANVFLGLSVSQRVLNAFEHIGLFPFVLFSLGLVITFQQRSNRRVVLLGVSSSLLSFVLFNRTSDEVAEHHNYLLLIGYFSVVGPALAASLSGRAPRRLANPAIACAAVAVLGCVAEPLWGVREQPALWRAAFGDLTLHPIQRSDLPEIQRLMEALDSVYAENSSASIYVLSSSPTFCDQTLTSGRLPQPGLRFNSAGRVLFTQQIDQRDGFPTNLLAAQIVVTTDPIQIHHVERLQRSVAVPDRAFIQHRGIATAFKQVAGPFHLENGVAVYVYLRTRDFTAAEVQDLSDEMELPLNPPAPR